MKTVIKYTIVRAPDWSELEKLVNSHLQHGWVPQGGAFYAGNEISLLGQAMVMYADNGEVI